MSFTLTLTINLYSPFNRLIVFRGFTAYDFQRFGIFRLIRFSSHLNIFTDGADVFIKILLTLKTGFNIFLNIIKIRRLFYILIIWNWFRSDEHTSELQS